MKSVDQYIKALLYEHDCVIVPGFGGLLARRIEACYVERLQQYIPVRKGVAFNEALRMDDGLLVYTIALREQVERSVAAEHVRKFVDNLKNRLALQKQVTLYGIGVFRLSEENKYVFEPDSTLNFESQWYGLPEVKLRPLRVHSFQEAIYESQPSEQVNNFPTRTRKQWMNWAAAAMIVAILGFVGFNSQKAMLDISGQLSSLVSVAQGTDSEDVVIRKQHSSMLPDAFRDNSSEITPSKEVISTAKAAVASAPLSYDYELVVGSFTTINAAESLKATLVNKGYENAYIVDKKSGRFYKVVAQGTNEIQKAHELRAELAKTVGSGVWILEHKN